MWHHESSYPIYGDSMVSIQLTDQEYLQYGRNKSSLRSRFFFFFSFDQNVIVMTCDSNNRITGPLDGTERKTQFSTMAQCTQSKCSAPFAFTPAAGPGILMATTESDK